VSAEDACDAEARPVFGFEVADELERFGGKRFYLLRAPFWVGVRRFRSRQAATCSLKNLACATVFCPK
jgi:hypothetical protein